MTDKVFAAWAKLLALITLAPVALYTNALVIQQWWLWFLVPYGLPSITLVQALTLRFAVVLLSTKPVSYADDDKSGAEVIARLLIWANVVPALFWVLGWALKTWAY